MVRPEGQSAESLKIAEWLKVRFAELYPAPVTDREMANRVAAKIRFVQRYGGELPLVKTREGKERTKKWVS